MVLLTDLSMLMSVLFLLIFVEPLGAISSFLTFSFFGYLFYSFSRKYLSKWGKQRQIHETLGIKHLQQGLGGIKDIKILSLGSAKICCVRWHNHDPKKIMTIKMPLTFFEIQI